MISENLFVAELVKSFEEVSPVAELVKSFDLTCVAEPAWLKRRFWNRGKWLASTAVDANQSAVTLFPEKPTQSPLKHSLFVFGPSFAFL